jgi:hypothetical protein
MEQADKIQAAKMKLAERTDFGIWNVADNICKLSDVEDAFSAYVDSLGNTRLIEGLPREVRNTLENFIIDSVLAGKYELV